MERAQLDRLQLDRFDDARRREVHRSGLSTPQSSRASIDYGNEGSMNWPLPVPTAPTSNASDPRAMLQAPLPASRFPSHSPLAKSDLTLPPLRSVSTVKPASRSQLRALTYGRSSAVRQTLQDPLKRHCIALLGTRDTSKPLTSFPRSLTRLESETTQKNIGRGKILGTHRKAHRLVLLIREETPKQ